MNLSSITLWGFAATVILTTLIIVGQSLGLTRIDMPFILGTIFTADRDRARVIGYFVHLVNGWALALLYALIFEYVHTAAWWLGMVIGVVQGAVVVTILFPFMPGVHPRMVSDFRGPEPTRLLEPPGCLAVNYGRATPWVLMLVHACYGLILGTFYRLR